MRAMGNVNSTVGENDDDYSSNDEQQQQQRKHQRAQREGNDRMREGKAAASEGSALPDQQVGPGEKSAERRKWVKKNKRKFRRRSTRHSCCESTRSNWRKLPPSLRRTKNAAAAAQAAEAAQRHAERCASGLRQPKWHFAKYHECRPANPRSAIQPATAPAKICQPCRPDRAPPTPPHCRPMDSRVNF